MDFVMENLVWFIVGAVVIIMTIIGYFAEKTDFGKKIDSTQKPKKTNKKEEKVEPIVSQTPAVPNPEPPKENNEEKKGISDLLNDIVVSENNNQGPRVDLAAPMEPAPIPSVASPVDAPAIEPVSASDISAPVIEPVQSTPELGSVQDIMAAPVSMDVPVVEPTPVETPVEVPTVEAPAEVTIPEPSIDAVTPVYEEPAPVVPVYDEPQAVEQTEEPAVTIDEVMEAPVEPSPVEESAVQSEVLPVSEPESFSVETISSPEELKVYEDEGNEPVIIPDNAQEILDKELNDPESVNKSLDEITENVKNEEEETSENTSVAEEDDIWKF